MMSVPEYLLIQDLKRRVEALEALANQWRTPPQVETAPRRGDAERLRCAIAQVLADASAPSDLSAKQVLRVLQSMDLGRTELPSVRTVQWHLRAIRNCT